MHRRALLAGAATAATALSSGCLSQTPVVASATRTETRTVPVDEGTTVAVVNPHGAVTVEPADGSEVEFEIAYEGPSPEAIDASEVTVAEADAELRFEADPEETSWLWEDVTVSPTVRLPEGVELGAVDAENGDVEVRDVAGDATVATTNGELTVRNLDGEASLSTTNGAVDASGIGRLRRATATNGAVELDVTGVAETANVEVENGSADLALSPDLDVTVDAAATNGEVEVEGLEFEDATREESAFSGTLGDGTNRLTVDVTNGAVSIGRLD